MAERPCGVCLHPSRLAIDQALLNGKALRAIARDFNIGSGEPGTASFKPDHKRVAAHRDKCLGKAYEAARTADLEASGLALVNRMIQMDEVVDEVIARHRVGEPIVLDGVPLLNDDGSPMVRYKDTVLLAAVREARRNTEMRAKLAGALPEGDEAALEAQRKALQNPKVRALLAQVDAIVGKDDQTLTY